MSLFDVEVSVLDASSNIPTPEALEQGAPPHLEFAIIAALVLPLANPQTGHPLVVPAGRIRFGLPREQAIDVFSDALKAAESLPEKTTASGKIMVAQSMADVDAAAQNIKRATGQ